MLGERKQALAWLEKAYADHDQDLAYLRFDPQFQGLRDDPEFVKLVARIAPALPAASAGAIRRGS